MEKKLVKESLNEAISIGGHTYDIIKVGRDRIQAGKKGMLGSSGNLIPWSIVRELLKKYAE